MATGFLLEVEPRQAGKRVARRGRRMGLVPGVLYGAHGDSVAVQVPVQALQQALAKGGGHQPFMVKQADKRDRHMALIKEIQRDLYTKQPVHVDLLTIARDKPVSTTVPLVVHGESDLARRGLLLHMQLRALPVEALPDALPESVELSVGELEVGASISVADLPVPEGVTVTADPGQMVLSVGEPRVYAEPEETTEEEAAEPALVGEEEKDEAAQ